MDPIIAGLITAAIAGAGSFILWYIKQIASDSDKNDKAIEVVKDKLQALEVKVAHEYVTKTEITQLRAWLTDQFKEVKDIIKDKADKE